MGWETNWTENLGPGVRVRIGQLEGITSVPFRLDDTEKMKGYIPVNLKGTSAIAYVYYMDLEVLVDGLMNPSGIYKHLPTGDLWRINLCKHHAYCGVLVPVVAGAEVVPVFESIPTEFAALYVREP